MDRYLIKENYPVPNLGRLVEFSLFLKNLGRNDTVFCVKSGILTDNQDIIKCTTEKLSFGDIPPGECRENYPNEYSYFISKLKEMG